MPTRLNYEHGCNARRANTPRLAQAPKEHTHTKHKNGATGIAPRPNKIRLAAGAQGGVGMQRRMCISFALPTSKYLTTSPSALVYVRAGRDASQPLPHILLSTRPL